MGHARTIGYYYLLLAGCDGSNTSSLLRSIQKAVVITINSCCYAHARLSDEPPAVTSIPALRMTSFQPDEDPPVGADDTTYLLADESSSAAPIKLPPCNADADSGHGLGPTDGRLEPTSHDDDDGDDDGEAGSLIGNKRPCHAGSPGDDVIVTSEHSGWDAALNSSFVLRVLLVVVPLAALCAAGMVFVAPAFSDPTSPLSFSLPPLLSLPHQHSRTNGKPYSNRFKGEQLRQHALYSVTPPPPLPLPALLHPTPS